MKKYLKFIPLGSLDEWPFLACIGSLGKLRKLRYVGVCDRRPYAQFVLDTEDGVYGLDTTAFEPGFQAMRFLSVWRGDVPGGKSNRVLFFNPQIVASIEKAGLSFMNPSRIDEYKEGDEIEILEEYAAIEYLKTANFSVDTFASACFGRILWCDKYFHPLCESVSDFSTVAKFDHGLWSVVSASHQKNGDGVWNNAYHEGFLEERYSAYAMTRNGVESKWEDWL